MSSAATAGCWAQGVCRGQSSNKGVSERTGGDFEVSSPKVSPSDGKKDMEDSAEAEFNNRKCSHNLDLETTTHTFMLHARPSPLCPRASVKRSPHWSCDEPSKAGRATFDDTYFA